MNETTTHNLEDSLTNLETLKDIFVLQYSILENDVYEFGVTPNKLG